MDTWNLLSNEFICYNPELLHKKFLENPLGSQDFIETHKNVHQETLYLLLS